MLRVPNQPATKHRSVRVSDELWEEAQRVAAERGEPLAEVIRRGLARYVRTYGHANGITEREA